MDVIDGQNDDNLGGAFLWESSIDITSETATLPGHSFTWLDAGGTPEARRVPDAVTFPAVLPVTNLTIDVPRVAVVPWAAIEAANGKLNSATYSRQPAETLMYMGASVKVQRSFNGSTMFGLSHRFKRRSIGWNFFWNPVAQAWRRTTPAVYATTSFSDLIPGVS
jgi:hypothetical protein